MCTIDINNAYDCVQLQILSDILRNIMVCIELLNWIINFLSNRNCCLGNDNVTVFNGLPQGSYLGPLPFNIYTARLHLLEDSKTKILQFADDFIILSWANYFDYVAANLHSKIMDFKLQCAELNLSFNLDKTKCLYFA